MIRDKNRALSILPLYLSDSHWFDLLFRGEVGPIFEYPRKGCPNCSQAENSQQEESRLTGYLSLILTGVILATYLNFLPCIGLIFKVSGVRVELRRN